MTLTSNRKIREVKDIPELAKQRISELLELELKYERIEK